MWPLAQCKELSFFLFQSTHPRRVWRSKVWCCLRTLIVSIHTPTKGVTYYNDYALYIAMFQSTHPRRVWPHITNLKILIMMFQSTHPRRVWPRLQENYQKSTVFQSTHPRRVWPIFSFVAVDDLMFQSTHPRRVWHWYPKNKYFWQIVSIHTPTKGVTLACATCKKWDMFQSTHPRRVWRTVPQLSTLLSCFNPHTHEGCDY